MFDARYFAYATISALLVMSPGATMAVVMETAIGEGRMAALCTVLGVNIGNSTLALGSALGMSFVFTHWPWTLQSVKALGAAYLAYLGLRGLWFAFRPRGTRGPVPGGISDPGAAPRGAGVRRGALQPVVRGVMTNLLNPPVILFYMTFLPQFIGAGDPFFGRFLVLAATHVSMSVVWLSIYAVALGMLAERMARPLVRRTLEGVTGAILVGLLGVAELVRRRRERGAVFARVMLVLFLLPASLVASKFVRYLLPALAVLDVVAALGVVRALDLMVGAGWSARARTAAGVLVAAVMVGAPLMAQVSSAPHYSLFQNAMGERLAAPGRTYPDDELYDTGMREAVSWIAERARPGAALASDAPGVVAEYLRRANRPDLEARSLSMEGLSTPPTEAWLLAQDSHSYFESLPVIEQVRRRRTPDFVYRVWGTPAVEVFRMPW